MADLKEDQENRLSWTEVGGPFREDPEGGEKGHWNLLPTPLPTSCSSLSCSWHHCGPRAPSAKIPQTVVGWIMRRNPQFFHALGVFTGTALSSLLPGRKSPAVVPYELVVLVLSSHSTCHTSHTRDSECFTVASLVCSRVPDTHSTDFR